MAPMTRATRVRRGYAIAAYVGPNGGGKTLSAVIDTTESLLAGRPCLSTVRLLDWENPRECEGDSPETPCPDHDQRLPGHLAAHRLYRPWTSWEQLLEFRGGDVLADEVTGVASSRSGGLPAAVMHVLVQLRKRDVVFRYTSPSWARADVILREVTQAVSVCRGYLATAEGTGDRAWMRKRLLRVKTYDASLLTEMTEGRRERLSPVVSEWVRVSRRPGRLAYDTLEEVSRIRDVSETGRCVTCGGTRRAYECCCDDYVEAKSARESRSQASKAKARRAM